MPTMNLSDFEAELVLAYRAFAAARAAHRIKRAERRTATRDEADTDKTLREALAKLRSFFGG